MKRNALKLFTLATILGVAVFTGCAKDRKIVVNEQRTLAFDYFHAGESLEAQGQFTQALEQYRKAYEASPRPAFAYKLGEIHHRMGDQQLAIDYYSEAIKGAGDFEIAQARKAQAELELAEGRDTDLSAFESYEKTQAPGDTSTVANVPEITRQVTGNTDFERRNEDEIVEVLFPELQPENQNNPVSLRESANLAIAQQRWADAISPLEQLFRNDPSVVNSIDLARAFYYSGQKQRAFDEFEAAAKRHPQNTDIHVQWGRMLAMDGKWEQAEVVFEKGLRLEPDSMRLLLNMASLKIDQGQYSDAVNRLEPIVDAYPDNFAANYNMALALLGEGTDLNRARDISLTLADNYPARRSQIEELLRKLGVDY